MHLMTQTCDRSDTSAVLMFTLMEKQGPRDADGVEVVFHDNPADGNGDSPDFVVPLDTIGDAVPFATFEIVDQPIGMALRVMSLRQLDEAIRLVMEFVTNRAYDHYKKPIVIGHPQAV